LPELASKVSTANPARLAVGVHRGPALVTTVNGRLDYFGAAARQALALPAVVGEGVTLTESVFSDPLVGQWLQERTTPGILRTIALPGRPETLVTHWSERP
jgi:eukaryotic-like serine/threonine-protein kinase